MALKDMLQRVSHRKEILREMEDVDYAQNKLSERKLTPNERLVLRLREKERQKYIKKELDNRLKREQHEYWHKDIISQKPLFNEKRKIMGGQKLYFLRRGVKKNG